MYERQSQLIANGCRCAYGFPFVLLLIPLDALSWTLFASEGGCGVVYVERPSWYPILQKTALVARCHVPLEFAIAQQGN